MNLIRQESTISNFFYLPPSASFPSSTSLSFVIPTPAIEIEMSKLETENLIVEFGDSSRSGKFKVVEGFLHRVDHGWRTCRITCVSWTRFGVGWILEIAG